MNLNKAKNKNLKIEIYPDTFNSTRPCPLGLRYRAYSQKVGTKMIGSDGKL